MLFKYNKLIDKKIAKAVAETLKEDILSVKKMTGGEVNHVYKIRTSQRLVIARVFMKPKQPSFKKLSWIEAQFKRNNITYPGIIFFSRGRKYFPNGWMISEYIEGITLADAIKKNIFTYEQSYFERGKMLKQVHKVKVGGFGDLNEGKGDYSNFIEGRLKRTRSLLRGYKDKNIFGKDIYKQIEKIVSLELSPYKSRFKPVIVHGDAARDNIIWTGNKFVLIDWDNAAASIALEEWTILSYWWYFESRFTKADTKKFTKAFFKGYGNPGFNTKEIIHIERALHILRCVELLNYFYFIAGNIKYFNHVKVKLLELLESDK